MIGKTYANTGADPGFQVRGAHFKKLRRAEGGAKIFGVFVHLLCINGDCILPFAVQTAGNRFLSK
jgi:hypothetical protein